MPHSVARDQLYNLITRIETLEEDKTTIQGDIKAVYAEGKGLGFDSKIVRKVVRLRRMDRATREEEAALVDLYLTTLDGPHAPRPVNDIEAIEDHDLIRMGG